MSESPVQLAVRPMFAHPHRPRSRQQLCDSRNLCMFKASACAPKNCEVRGSGTHCSIAILVSTMHHTCNQSHRKKTHQSIALLTNAFGGICLSTKSLSETHWSNFCLLPDSFYPTERNLPGEYCVAVWFLLQSATFDAKIFFTDILVWFWWCSTPLSPHLPHDTQFNSLIVVVPFLFSFSVFVLSSFTFFPFLNHFSHHKFTLCSTNPRGFCAVTNKLTESFLSPPYRHEGPT